MYHRRVVEAEAWLLVADFITRPFEKTPAEKLVTIPCCRD